MSAMAASLGAGIPIKNRITCPHCWSSFPPDQTLWVAQHPDLAGNPRLGSDHPKRFLPSRFNLQGDALDAPGFACHELACPKCHLSVPRAFFEMTPVFVSILGVAGVREILFPGGHDLAAPPGPTHAFFARI